MENPLQHSYDFRLDNAGKLFPAIHSSKRTTMFRIAALLNQPVQVALLQKAAEKMMERCPYYQVSLSAGLFWYYLESTDTLPVIHGESIYPCMKIPLKKRGTLPFRIIAYRNRIALEMSHLLADGRASMAFLNGLILEYFRQKGEDLPSEGVILDCRDQPDPQEFSDSYKKYFEKIVPKAPKLLKAAQLQGRSLAPPAYRIIAGSVETAELKTRAAEMGVSIGEYLTALLLKVLCDKEREKKKMRPLIVTIPIDVRQFYPSKTMRNFMLTLEPEYDPRLGDISLEQLVKKVHHYMRHGADERLVKTQISRNIRGETHALIRIIPLFLKKPILKWINRTMGEKTYTMSFSNLGRVKIPQSLEDRIVQYEFLPPRSHRRVNATALGYKDRTSITFGSTLDDKSVEAEYFASLRKLGLAVKIETNLFDQRRN